MLRPMALAAMLLILAPQALAQPAEPPVLLLPDRAGAGAPAQARPLPRLFISPSGEPFRGPDGLGAWLGQADADHDGAIVLAEFRADAQRFFALLDANQDGVLDAFEIQDYERKRAPEIAGATFEEAPRGWRKGSKKGAKESGQSAGLPKTPRAGSEGAARFSLINEPQPVANADADVDGRVTLSEWTQAANRRFARLDKTLTGRLTRESLLAPPQPVKR